MGSFGSVDAMVRLRIPCRPAAYAPFFRSMTSPALRISELHDHVGTTATVRGWVTHVRSSGKVAFAVIRDGTGILQAVLVKAQVTPEVWSRFGELTTEASVSVTGEVKADARAPGGYEIGATDLTIIGPSPIDYPIQPKEHGIDFLLDNRHLWLRSNRQRAIFVVRNEIEQSIHDFFYERGFLRVDTPILTAAIGERSGLFATEYFDEGNAYLAQTGQLYGEAAAAAFGKIYTFGPTFRAEKSKTRRHLTEFWMIEPEVAWNDSNDNMRLQEDFVSYIVQRALARCVDALKVLERDTTKLQQVKAAVRAHRLHRRDRDPQEEGKRDEVGRRPRRRRRGADRRRPRQAGLRGELPEGGQGLLYEGESGRSAHGALRRLPGAGRLRRDHRRVTARGRLRQVGPSHQGRRAADGCVRLVSRPAEERGAHHTPDLGWESKGEGGGRWGVPQKNEGRPPPKKKKTPK